MAAWLHFSVAVRVVYIALFGIAVETGVVMVVYLHEALDHRLAAGDQVRRPTSKPQPLRQRLRLKLMTVCAVLASLIPISGEWHWF